MSVRYAGNTFYIILSGMVDVNVAMAKTHNIDDMAKVGFRARVVVGWYVWPAPHRRCRADRCLGRDVSRCR